MLAEIKETKKGADLFVWSVCIGKKINLSPLLLLRMVVDADKYMEIKEALKSGDTVTAAKKLGGWATTDPIQSTADVRNNLAISSEWKGQGGNPMYVVEFTTKPGIGVREGTVGPMYDKNMNTHLPGGGHQVQFMDKSPYMAPDMFSIDPAKIRKLP